ncbi:MAG TPA: Ldh family oxidoreductase [Acidimicrobiia bacterium]|jgi:LDH2 family malate/lactate/ureidoglycolate dehydrogenase
MSERFPIDRLVRFVASILEAQGVRPDHAETCARRMVEADRRGRTGHGLFRLAQYSTRIRAGGYNLAPEIRILHETPVSALVDGDNGLGQVIMTRAAEVAIEKAAANGIGWVGTTNSNHAGAAGIYPAMALDHGLGAFYFAVANGNGMPPWGGIERLLGTNPIAFAMPAGREIPFELDIATTVASHGTIKVTAQAGEQMPEGWVVDADGNPITDPNRADEGFLMPIGGYKGTGLNIMIGLLAGVMTGSAFGRDVVPFRTDHTTPTNTGQAMIAFRPDLFSPLEEYQARIDAKLTELRASATTSGDPVRLPGERSRALALASDEQGIEVPSALRSTLDDLAAQLGVAPLA